MPKKRQKWHTVLTVAVVAAATSLFGAVTYTAYAQEGDGVLIYSALGDSYSSGHGASFEYVDTPCRRSDRSYPYDFYKMYRATMTDVPGANMSHVACTGARINDVIQNQLSTVLPTTDLVTISIGGNDLDFAQTASICVLAPSLACEAAIEYSSLHVADTVTRAGQLLGQLHTQAPNAKIIWVSYPLIFSNGPDCSPLGLALTDRDRIRQVQADFNVRLQAMVEKSGTGAVFADTNKFFSQHQVCDSDRWINAVPDAIVAADVAAAYHPNEKGHTAMATAVLEAATGGTVS